MCKDHSLQVTCMHTDAGIRKVWVLYYEAERSIHTGYGEVCVCVDRDVIR